MGVPWNLALAASLAWIVYRIYQVFQKPVDELVDVLGIDIPPTPDVALAGITTDSVLLYWKPPESYHTPLKHYIQVNGINVGEFDRNDASVSVTGLKPGCFYGIRAIATNSASQSSFGRLIQIQTVPLAGHRGSRLLASADSSAPKNIRRNGSGRRALNAVNGNEQSRSLLQDPAGNEDDETEGTFATWTKKLDILRRGQDEVDRQMADATEEAERIKTSLSQERDDLRKTVEEKERAHLELKRQVNDLEKQCKASQRRKSAKERLLQQKRAERQKMQEEISRWKKETVEMRNETETILKEKVELDKAYERKMAETRDVIENVHVENKRLEEEIRDWGNKIKTLEEDRKKLDHAQDEEEQEAEMREKEKEHTHEMRMHEYQAQYAVLWNTNQQAEAECLQAQDRLNYLLSLRQKDPSKFAPIPGLDFGGFAGPHSQRRMRQGTSRASTVSHPSASYTSGVSAMNSISSISPSFQSASPYFNISNGMAGLGALEPSGGMSKMEVERLTGGAPMSPSANTLLPSNLLHDDDFPEDAGSSALLKGSTPYMPLSIDTQDPQSPLSVNSRSPSLLSSPHESLHNLHGYYPTTGEVEHYAGSPYASADTTDTNLSNARRLTGLFTFNRQRGKASANEPPTLGTLKQGQSQSFPRNLDSAPFSPALPSRRRSGSGTWTNPMEKFLASRNGGSGNDTDESSTPSTRAGFPRRSRLNVFGSKLGPSDVSMLTTTEPSSRPSSTYSYEHILPRPSSDSQPFGWMAAYDASRQRNSPLGGDRSSISPWSRNQSRRASIQHGSTSNLSLGTTPLDIEGYTSPYASKITPPAPIGTERFQLSKRTPAPKLNPAAPSFTQRLFNRNEAKKGSKSEKVEKNNEKNAEKSKAKDKDAERTPEPNDNESLPDDSSPSASRLSRDAHSIGTSTSLGDYDSLEHTHSASPSDAGGGGGAGSSAPKETLMQRLTRKSSSSKFNVPWSKDGRGSLFGKSGKPAGEPSTPDEVDEDTGADYMALGKGVGADVVTSATHLGGSHEKAARSISSWSRVMRKAKRGEVAASAASEEGEKVSEAEAEAED